MRNVWIYRKAIFFNRINFIIKCYSANCFNIAKQIIFINFRLNIKLAYLCIYYRIIIINTICYINNSAYRKWILDFINIVIFITINHRYFIINFNKHFIFDYFFITDYRIKICIYNIFDLAVIFRQCKRLIKIYRAYTGWFNIQYFFFITAYKSIFALWKRVCTSFAKNVNLSV